jgi:hypothetical protein
MEILISQIDKEMVLSAFNGIKENCDKTTSGNLSHNLATIKGRCIRLNEYIEKHWNKEIDTNDWISVNTRFPEIENTDFNRKYGFSVTVLIKIDFGYKIGFAFGSYCHIGKAWDVKPFIPGELNVIEWKYLK